MVPDDLDEQDVGQPGANALRAGQSGQEFGIEQSVLRTWRRKLRPAAALPATSVGRVCEQLCCVMGSFHLHKRGWG